MWPHSEKVGNGEFEYPGVCAGEVGVEVADGPLGPVDPWTGDGVGANTEAYIVNS